MGLDPAADEPFIDTQVKRGGAGRGDTAMDCVRTALRHGAAKVTSLSAGRGQHAGLKERG